MPDNSTINSFLDSILTFQAKVAPTKEESLLIKSGRLLDVIYSRLTSTKFRKSKVDEGTADFVKKYLDQAISQNQPIRLYFLFGGYKQARLASCPHPEWAEIFNLQFALQVASVIESVYEPGVDVIYRGDEVVVTLLDNYKKASREQYKKEFEAMIDLFQESIPSDRKISVRYELTSETSPEEKLFPLMESLYPKYLAKHEALPEDVQQQHIAKAYRNHCWNGEDDLTMLDEEKKLERARWSYIMHDAFLEADVTIAEDFVNNGVSITFRSNVPGCLHFGSCSSSSVQFWAGEGFLNAKDGRIIPWILSNDQQEGMNYEHVIVENPTFNELGLTSIRVMKDFA